MTFREAVERMRNLKVPHSIVQYAYKFDSDGKERVECGLYTEKCDGIWVWGDSWESAFGQMEDKIHRFNRTPQPASYLEGAPENDVIVRTVVRTADEEIPF